MRAEDLARLFHETYEELAPTFGYETREASRKPWPDVPEQNRKLMAAVCEKVLAVLGSEPETHVGAKIMNESFMAWRNSEAWPWSQPDPADEDQVMRHQARSWEAWQAFRAGWVKGRQELKST